MLSDWYQGRRTCFFQNVMATLVGEVAKRDVSGRGRRFYYELVSVFKSSSSRIKCNNLLKLKHNVQKEKKKHNFVL